MADTWRSNASEHQFGDAECTACDPGWPQQHSEVAEHCCPGLIHKKTVRTEDASSAQSQVTYYCDLCYEDDPF